MHDKEALCHWASFSSFIHGELEPSDFFNGSRNHVHDLVHARKALYPVQYQVIFMMSSNSTIPWCLARNLKMLVSSFLPLSLTILYTHPHAILRSSPQNLLILSSLEREVWKKVVFLRIYHCWLTQNYTWPPHCMSHHLCFVRKAFPPLSKRDCLSIPQFTLFKLHLELQLH
jgi:hypothetical protein